MPPLGPTSVNEGNSHVYQLPKLNVDAEGDSLSLTRLAGYARAARRKAVVGHKLEMRLTAGLEGADDYSPYGSGGVGDAVRDKNSDAATDKYNNVVIVTPGDAILGFPARDIPFIFRSESAKSPFGNRVRLAGAGGPIMTGKGMFMGDSAGLNAIPMPLEIPMRRDQQEVLDRLSGYEHDEQYLEFAAENFAYVMYAMANSVGAFNVEDASLNFIRHLWPKLAGLPAMFWSDDMQGTGIVVGGFSLAWSFLKQHAWHSLGRTEILRDVKVGMYGAGAGGYGVYRQLKALGAKNENILVFDTGPRGIGINERRMYPIHTGRDDIEDNWFKREMATGKPAMTPDQAEKFFEGAHGLINLASPEALSWDRRRTDRILHSMPDGGFLLACTNPNRALDSAYLRRIRPDFFYGSGDMTDVNFVNNFGAFSFVLGGGLMAHAATVNDAMTVAAAWGFFENARLGPPDWLRASLGPDRQEFGAHWLTSHPQDIRLIENELKPVAIAAVTSDVSSRFKPGEIEAAHATFDREARFRTAYVELRRQEDRQHREAHLRLKHGNAYAPLAWQGKSVWDVPPAIDLADFKRLASETGVSEDMWSEYLVDDQFNPQVLTLILERLQTIMVGNGPWQKIATEELDIIIKIALVYPELGLALALRRYHAGKESPNYKHESPTVFHKGGVMETIRREIRIAEADVAQFMTRAEAYRDSDDHEPPPSSGGGKKPGEAATEAAAAGEVATTGDTGAGGGTTAMRIGVDPQALVVSAQTLIAGAPNLVAANSDVEGTWAPVIDLRPADGDAGPVAEAAGAVVNDSLEADALDDQGVFGSAVDPTAANVVPFARSSTASPAMRALRIAGM